MVNIIKEELLIEESLRKKLELICEFAKTTPMIKIHLCKKRFIQIKKKMTLRDKFSLPSFLYYFNSNS